MTDADQTPEGGAIEKPWQGRFTEPTDAFVEAFTASITFDQKLYRHDIAGSIAHARMLGTVGVLTALARDAIVEGLEAIEADIAAGRHTWSIALEDVHMNVEAELTRRIGQTGKKLHTGRSRNDQIATDIRLYLREEVDEIVAALRRLQEALVTVAEREADTIMPGFTHLQTAQPVTFGHHMLAWYEMLVRDEERFIDCRRRINRLPLGAAALAGTTFPIDRELTARLLDFDGVCANSLDAVSDRDFVTEVISACALAMGHLSRFSEEIILWCSAQFDFIELGDSFCTGSSIMPQKKNPDVPELIRGKAARVTGALVTMMTLMKGQPLAYNKDNQEDKEPVFDAVETLRGSLRVYADMLPTMTVHRERTREAAMRGFSTATDLADYLVRAGMPFRDAHEVVGKAVRLAIDTRRGLEQLTLDEYQVLTPLIEADVYAVLTVEGSVAARAHIGGTAPSQVRAAVARARERARLSN
ncbi:MAG: argininosuccinate lyase [Pseudomonadota bacterium]